MPDLHPLMIIHPFSSLQPYREKIGVWMFTKDDQITTDDQVCDQVQIKSYAGLKQVHHNRTVIVRAPEHSTTEADGMITDQPGLLLITRWGDCQNFLIYAPEHHVIGVLHAGWRGIDANAIGEFFTVMKQEWGIDASETIVGAGPSLCKTCAEFTDPRNELTNVDPRFIDGKCADLQAIALQQCIDAGVKRQNVERHTDCTRCHPEKYWTYRGGDREAMMRGCKNVLACALQ